jgi:cathepsin L
MKQHMLLTIDGNDNAGNFTAACASDRRKLQMDSDVYKTVLQVVQISTGVVLDVMDSCEKDTTKCATPFGGGSCCSADGAGQWAKEQAVYVAYEEACAKVEEGDLMWFVEQVTTGGSGEPIVQSTYEHTLPLFISKNCQSSDNLATLFKALNQDCVSNEGAILKCEYSNSSSADFSSNDQSNTHLSFDEYLQSHAKSYNSDEYATRKVLFEQVKTSVILQNQRYAAGASTWHAALNHLADATDAELKQYGAKRARVAPIASSSTTTTTSTVQPPTTSTTSTTSTTPTTSTTSTNPSTKSWTAYQSPIKNQGSCGSCWAISSTEVLESHLAIAENTTDPLILSAQQLVSCTPNPNECGGTGGCEGATAEIGFNYTNHHGIALASTYPYTGKDDTCKPKPFNTAVTNSGFTKLPPNSAIALETAIATIGPVSVVVAANWQTYSGGIMADGCLAWLGSCDLDHVVVVVGYSENYWLVRNSWGENWGESGYIRLTRKNDNTTYTDTDTSQGTGCKPFPKQQSVMGEGGILFDASYPNNVTRS